MGKELEQAKFVIKELEQENFNIKYSQLVPCLPLKEKYEEYFVSETLVDDIELMIHCIQEKENGIESLQV